MKRFGLQSNVRLHSFAVYFVDSALLYMSRLQMLLITSFVLMNLWVAPVVAPRPPISPTAAPVLVVSIEQIVTGLTQSAYEEEKAACDLTIQHTVVDNILGTTIDQVTDIIVEDINDSEHTNSLTTAAVLQCYLKYKVMSDSSVTLDTVEAQLTNATQSGKMDESLHHYAIVFGATSLVNSTLSAPLITNEVDQGGYSDSPKRGKIAGLVIGSVVFFALLVGLLLVYKIQHLRQLEVNAARQKPSKPKCEVEV